MNSKLKEVKELLSKKVQEVEALQKEVSDASLSLEAASGRERNLQQELKLKEESNAATVRDYQRQLDTLNKVQLIMTCGFP